MDHIIAVAIPAVNSHSDAAVRHSSRMSEMGHRVRALRKARGMTQVALAKSVGVSQGAISDIERGDTTEMMGPTLAAICTALRTNPNWLLTGKGSPAPSVLTSFDEGELLAIFRELGDEQRAAVMTVARSMQATASAPSSEAHPYRSAKRTSPTKV
jgi:transcriptional regulator with XRE-family HTH domain